MKYQNKTKSIVYTYVNDELVSVLPGHIVTIVGYKPPTELTLIEDMSGPRNLIQRRRFERLGLLPEPEPAVEEVLAEQKEGELAKQEREAAAKAKLEEGIEESTTDTKAELLLEEAPAKKKRATRKPKVE